MKTNRFRLCAWLLCWGAPSLAWADPPDASAHRQTTPYRRWVPKVEQGPYFLLGAGTEGYSGSLAPAIQPGLAYGVLVGYRVTPHLGFELGYSGAVNEVDLGLGDVEPVSGADIVRNGGQLAATLGLTHTRLQPYVLGGVGFERYSVRFSIPTGLSSDASGYIPAGLGLRYHLGPVFTADARVSLNVPFGQDFAPDTDGWFDYARYQGLLQLGATY